jgi:hypothetical protein
LARSESSGCRESDPEGSSRLTADASPAPLDGDATGDDALERKGKEDIVAFQATVNQEREYVSFPVEMGNTKKEGREETHGWSRGLSDPTIKMIQASQPAGEIPPESMIRPGKWQENPDTCNEPNPKPLAIDQKE